ncbi:MAG: DeoR/GlpR transcriptional regulator [Clostridia bacterium]|nr:DeoR/GlpR transcriptional regulator [Clostridia bacterium]
MFAKERQDLIYEMILKNNAVTVSKLVEKFAVSIETVRRDLLEMERQGLLTRVHGGAVAKTGMSGFSVLSQRNSEHGEQKKALSLKACEFINDGEIIAVDAGSTATFFAEALKEKFTKLTVITHSLDVFNILNSYKDFSVILCGGHYIREENTFYGSLTVNMFSSLYAQKAFIFTSAVSLEHGICDFRQEFYDVQKVLLGCADEIFILADSSKFEKKALLKLTDMKNDYIYITDSDLPNELKELYKENGIKIYTNGEY